MPAHVEVATDILESGGIQFCKIYGKEIAKYPTVVIIIIVLVLFAAI